MRTPDMRTWFTSLRRRGFTAQSAVLLATVLAVYGLVAPVAGSVSGPVGLAVAAIAAGLCLLGAGLALAACRLFGRPEHALHALLAGMLLRMGVPLGFALALQVRGGPVAEAGLLVYLVVFYPVTLFVETALSLPNGDRPQHPGDVSENAAL